MLGYSLLVPAFISDTAATILIALFPRLDPRRGFIAAVCMGCIVAMVLALLIVAPTDEDEASMRASLFDAMKDVVLALNSTNGSVNDSITRLPLNTSSAVWHDVRKLDVTHTDRHMTFSFELDKTSTVSAMRGFCYGCWLTFNCACVLLQGCLNVMVWWPQLSCTLVWMVVLAPLLLGS